MRLLTEPYLVQNPRWPKTGRVLLAQTDSESVIVYQAYRPTKGHFAAKYGYFGNGFSMSRMTWIKPNFLWMMYRSGWGTKEGQEVTLVIRLKRNAFDEILGMAVHSTFTPQVYGSQEAWKHAVASSHVRLQWDPDMIHGGNLSNAEPFNLDCVGPSSNSMFVIGCLISKTSRNLLPNNDKWSLRENSPNSRHRWKRFTLSRTLTLRDA